MALVQSPKIGILGGGLGGERGESSNPSMSDFLLHPPFYNPPPFSSLFGGGKRRSYKWSVIGREGLTICRWGEEEGGEGLLFWWVDIGEEVRSYNPPSLSQLSFFQFALFCFLLWLVGKKTLKGKKVCGKLA